MINIPQNINEQRLFWGHLKKAKPVAISLLAP